MRLQRIIMLMLAATFNFVAACAGPPDQRTRTGQVELALHSTVGGITYELRNATFAIKGATELELSSEDAPEAAVLEQELPVGDYTAELGPDWHLFEVAEGEETELDAVLASENPAAFSISEQATTEVVYRFTIDGTDVPFASGTLRIGMDVTVAQDPTDAGRGSTESVIFTEVMRDPSALADTAGEWFELQNVGTETVDLAGCVIARDAAELTVSEPLELKPGGIVTLARSESPGFVPDVVYSSISLPNSSSFVLSLSCEGQLVDSITVDPATWPDGSGVAASLSASSMTAADNDNPTAWCAATATYAIDLGTPGSQNPACS
ncbi:MAG: lamin tail domain-containing protein [Polyangiaceae bacterium]|nr:lamin tail domain-containing protein [Polyangiaceae bacterium]